MASAMRVDTLLVAQRPPFVNFAPADRADSVQRVDIPPEQAIRLQPAPPPLQQEALREPIIFVLPAAGLLGERPPQIVGHALAQLVATAMRVDTLLVAQRPPFAIV